MPDPTREQFDAAARKVMETAPPGLSREEFFGLIDREIQGSRLGVVPEDAPDTFWGGFTDHIKKGVSEAFTGKDTLDALGTIARPESLSDFMNLLIPAQAVKPLTGMLGKGKPAGETVGRALEGAGHVLQNYDITKPAKPIGQAAGAIGRKMRPKAPTAQGVDRYMPNVGAEVPPQGASMMHPQTAMRPDMVPTELSGVADEGAEGVSKFRKGSNPEFTGVGEEDWFNAAQPPAPPSAMPDTFSAVADSKGMAQPMPDAMYPPAGPPRDPMLDEMMSTAQLGEPRIMSLKPDAMSPEDWLEARRYYGSRKLAELTGKTPQEIERLAPGPSRTPLEVEDRMNQSRNIPE